MTVRKPEHSRHHPEKATVKAHTAIPDTEQVERVSQQQIDVIEQNIPQATANHDAQYDVEQQIADLIAGETTPGMPPRPVDTEEQTGEKAEQVHQSVPLNLDRTPDVQCDGVELGVDHQCIRSRF